MNERASTLACELCDLSDPAVWIAAGTLLLIALAVALALRPWMLRHPKQRQLAVAFLFGILLAPALNLLAMGYFRYSIRWLRLLLE